jgi:serine/threonine protein kinase
MDNTHENVIRVLQFGELRQSPFSFVDMELCQMTLHDYLYKHQGFAFVSFPKLSTSLSFKASPEQRIGLIALIMEQVARGLQYIHGHGEVHRDLKPQNSSFPAQGNN